MITIAVVTFAAVGCRNPRSDRAQSPPAGSAVAADAVVDDKPTSIAATSTSTSPTTRPASSTIPRPAATSAPAPQPTQFRPPSTSAPIPQPVFPYGDFYSVPRLGTTESVRGTGCGADGSIGDIIPDGTWAGRIVTVDPPETSPRTFKFNLICIFTGEGGSSLVAEIAANQNVEPSSLNSDYLRVDNNDRTRTVPIGASFQLRDGETTELGCIDPGTNSTSTRWQHHDVWLHIQGGEAQWALVACH